MILVTGGSGFVGSHIVKQLIADSSQVRVLVRDPERAQREGRLEGLPVEWVVGDVTRPDSLPPAMNGVHSIIHTVAIAIEKGQATYEKVNYQGTVHVVEAAKQAGVRRFVNMSQLGAASDLPYRFLASKGRAQEYVAQSGLDWTAFRPSTIFGPEDEFANTFARFIPLTPIIFPIVGTEQSRFQPVWVNDVAAAVLHSLDEGGTLQEEFELGGPEELTIEEIERRTLKALGAQRIMVHFPLPLLRVIVAIMERAFPNPPVTSSLLELLQVNNVPSDNRLSRFVDQPTAFTPENIRPYMSEFTVGETLRKYFRK